MRRRVWYEGERAARDAYRSRGYRVVARNWRSVLGELDLVVARDGTLVFVEVKARSSARLGGPFEAVTVPKQRRLRRLAEAFVSSERPAEHRFRFDVASVTFRDPGRPDVYVFEDAF